MKLTHLAGSLAAVGLFFSMGPATAQQTHTGTNSAPVLLVAPKSLTMNDSLGHGCWARLYDKPGYDGKALTLVGPVDIRETGEGLVAGSELGRNFDSLVVGPHAALRVWDDQGFEGKTQQFVSGQTVKNLDNRMGFFDNVRSVRVTCDKQPVDAAAMPPPPTKADDTPIPVTKIVFHPIDYLGQPVIGTGKVVDVVSDRGFWLEKNGQRMFVMVAKSPAMEPAVNVNPGQHVRLAGVVYSDQMVSQIAGGIEVDAQHILADQPVFLLVNATNVVLMED